MRLRVTSIVPMDWILGVEPPLLGCGAALWPWLVRIDGAHTHNMMNGRACEHSSLPNPTDWDAVPQLEYLGPFLKLVRDEQVSGPITGVALTALWRLFSSDVIGADARVAAVAAALCWCSVCLGGDVRA